MAAKQIYRMSRASMQGAEFTLLYVIYLLERSHLRRVQLGIGLRPSGSWADVCPLKTSWAQALFGGGHVTPLSKKKTTYYWLKCLARLGRLESSQDI